MSIYIAGKWDDKENVTHKMKQFNEMGFIITHDWTKNETKTKSSEDLGKFAELDINGVLNADFMVATMEDPKYAYRGSFTEIGCALGTNKQVLIYCPDKDSYCRTNCFFHHPNIIHFTEWDKLAKYALNIKNSKKQ